MNPDRPLLDSRLQILTYPMIYDNIFEHTVLNLAPRRGQPLKLYS
nr:MAG TPA: hypothetical protein [Caudoviricetes sp.]